MSKIYIIGVQEAEEKEDVSEKNVGRYLWLKMSRLAEDSYMQIQEA